jgi:hypothetical protein
METSPHNLDTIRNQALNAGAIDPMTLRFRIVECDRFDGELLSVPVENISFPEAIEHTANLAKTRSDSHFYLEPVGFIQ